MMQLFANIRNLRGVNGKIYRFCLSLSQTSRIKKHKGSPATPAKRQKVPDFMQL